MVTRPVMRYPGGKWRIAKWIISYFPQHTFYIEPYCGGAAVLLHKPRTQAEIINDLDGDVVNVFRVLRDPKTALELERITRLTPFAYEEYKGAYDPCDDPVERARRTIFRSFASIGSDGIHRRNSGFRGLKNYAATATAAEEWSRWPDAIPFFVNRLRNVMIEHRPALHLLKLYDRAEALFYVDPPYVMSTRSRDSVIYSEEMNDGDHEELADVLHHTKGMVILSGYQSALYDRLYGDWQVVKKTSTAQNGKGRVECLWLSPNIKTTLF
jgi:DNA adenine methylase